MRNKIGIRKKNCLLLGALLAMNSGFSFSYAATPMADEIYDLGGSTIITKVVTAARTEQTKVDVPADATVIDTKRIEEGHYTNVSDALKANQVPVVQNGYASYPVLNGDTRVLVMVDGRPMNWNHLVVSGDDNAVNIDQIPMANVERIEVVKGPSSSLYGEKAVAGVINIITKKAQPGNITKLRAEYGSWNERNFGFSTSGGDETNRYSLTYTKEKRSDFKYKSHFDGNRSFTFPDSYYDRNKVTARFDHYFSDDRLSLDLSRFEGKDGFGIYLSDPAKNKAYGNGSRNHTNDGSYGVTYTFGAKTDGEGTFIRAYRNTEKTDSPFALTPYSHNLSKDTFEGQKTWKLNTHTIIAGTTYTNEHIRENNDGVGFNKSAYVAAAYAEDKWDFYPTWSVNYGTRYEHHNTFGSDWTSHVGLNKKLSKDTHAYISWGQAVNNPTLKMMYADSPYMLGNPDLKQEKSYTTTIGIDSQLTNKLSLSASAFESRLKDALDWQWNPATGKTSYFNVNREKRQGLNLSANYHFNDNWSLNAGYTFMKIRQQGAVGGYVNDPDNRQPNYYHMNIRWQKNKWSAEMAFIYVTGRSVARYSSNSYLNVDANVNYQVNKNLKAYMKGYNLLNRAYEITPYMIIGAYPMPGRHVVGGVEYTF